MKLCRNFLSCHFDNEVRIKLNCASSLRVLKYYSDWIWRSRWALPNEALFARKNRRQFPNESGRRKVGQVTKRGGGNVAKGAYPHHFPNSVSNSSSGKCAERFAAGSCEGLIVGNYNLRGAGTEVMKTNDKAEQLGRTAGCNPHADMPVRSICRKKHSCPSLWWEHFS